MSFGLSIAKIQVAQLSKFILLPFLIQTAVNLFGFHIFLLMSKNHSKNNSPQHAAYVCALLFACCHWASFISCTFLS